MAGAGIVDRAGGPGLSACVTAGLLLPHADHPLACLAATSSNGGMGGRCSLERASYTARGYGVASRTKRPGSGREDMLGARIGYTGSGVTAISVLALARAERFQQDCDFSSSRRRRPASAPVNRAAGMPGRRQGRSGAPYDTTLQVCLWARRRVCAGLPTRGSRGTLRQDPPRYRQGILAPLTAAWSADPYQTQEALARPPAARQLDTLIRGQRRQGDLCTVFKHG